MQRNGACALLTPSTEMTSPVQYPQKSFAKAPNPTRPVYTREMAPIDPNAMLEMQQNLSRLMAHMNEAPLVPAVAAAAGAAEQSTSKQEASSKECAKPVKFTTRQYTTRQENADQVGVGYTRQWTKEEVGWSFVDCNSGKPVQCTTRQLTSRKDNTNKVREGYTRHWTKEEYGWSFIDWIHSE